MNAAVEAFNAGASALRDHVRGLQLEWQLLAASCSTPPCSAADAAAATWRSHIGSGIGKRRFDYNSVVISLYGLLEQYVEALVRDYALHLHSVTSVYTELPEAFQKAHTELSIALLGKLEQSRYRGVISARAVTAKLHSCLNGDTPFTLNLEALYQHTANFRSDVIASTLARLGVLSAPERLRQSGAMKTHLANLYPDRDLATVTLEEIYQPINDLAERRNEVAHGSASSLLSNEILLDYLAACEAFCLALHELLTAEAMAFEVSRRGILIGKPIAVYNNSIICIELHDQPLKLGDVLVVETGQSAFPFVGGTIEEIQIDRVAVDSVPPMPSVKVGCKVAFRAKESHTVYLLPAMSIRSVEGAATPAATSAESDASDDGAMTELERADDALEGAAADDVVSAG